jgi:site-specific DNA-methyltransferase (cytosine-N4-specific)
VLVVDPCGGSNVTGLVDQGLVRRWLSVEINGEYVEGSRLRFDDAVATSVRTGSAAG